MAQFCNLEYSLCMLASSHSSNEDHVISEQQCQHAIHACHFYLDYSAIEHLFTGIILTLQEETAVHVFEYLAFFPGCMYVVVLQLTSIQGHLLMVDVPKSTSLAQVVFSSPAFVTTSTTLNMRVYTWNLHNVYSFSLNLANIFIIIVGIIIIIISSSSSSSHRSSSIASISDEMTFYCTF